MDDKDVAEVQARLTAHRRVYALVLFGCAAYVLGVLVGHSRIGFGMLGWLLVSAGTVAIMRRGSLHLESWALSKDRRSSIAARLVGPVSKQRVLWNVVSGVCLIGAGSWSLHVAIVQLQ